MRNNPYVQAPNRTLSVEGRQVAVFVSGVDDNLDASTIASFGQEWEKFHSFSSAEIDQIGADYFDVVDETKLHSGMLVLDLGCGSGRWTRYVASRAGFVEAVDPSAAVAVAVKTTADLDNVRVTQAAVDRLPFADESFDFIVCLGVLHHIPDTQAALKTACGKLKPGGHLLLYLYYALDNRGAVFRLIFVLSGLLRRVVCRLPQAVKKMVCDVLAVVVYLPFITLAKLVKTIANEDVAKRVPLNYYIDKSWHVIRNDALDRFGTPLEQRFSRSQIEAMMLAAGLVEIDFSEHAPFWHVLGKKRSN